MIICPCTCVCVMCIVFVFFILFRFRSDDPPPEKLPPPGEWQNQGKRDSFQHMLILRCLRPDRVVFAARHFIATNLGMYTFSQIRIIINITII